MAESFPSAAPVGARRGTSQRSPAARCGGRSARPHRLSVTLCSLGPEATPPSARPGHRRGCAGPQTCGPDHQMPTCAACAGSRVPWPAPLLAPDRALVFTGDLLAFQTGAASPLLPFAMCPALPGSDYYESSAPDLRHRRTLRLACAPRGASATLAGSHVHCRSLDGIDAQLFPCGPVATLTRARVALPGHMTMPRRTAPPVTAGSRHRLTQPVSIGFEPGSTLKGVLALVHFVTPLRLVRRARTVR